MEKIGKNDVLDNKIIYIELFADSLLSLCWVAQFAVYADQSLFSLFFMVIPSNNPNVRDKHEKSTW